MSGLTTQDNPKVFRTHPSKTYRPLIFRTNGRTDISYCSILYSRLNFLRVTALKLNPRDFSYFVRGFKYPKVEWYFMTTCIRCNLRPQFRILMDNSHCYLPIYLHTHNKLLPIFQILLHQIFEIFSHFLSENIKIHECTYNGHSTLPVNLN